MIRWHAHPVPNCYNTPVRTGILLLVVMALICSSAGASICPKGAPPAKTLYVADVAKLPMDDQLFFSSLQGITAQRQPRIYLIRDVGADEFWLKQMLAKGYVKQVKRVDPWELPKIFRAEIKGAVIPDPDLPATINIATMLAGVHQLVICTPAQVERLNQVAPASRRLRGNAGETPALPVEYDLRGKWTKNTDAYQWALDQLGPKLDRRILCSLNPNAAQHRIRDYLVQHKVFTLWICGDKDADRKGATPDEKEFFRAVLAKWPANIPVIGFWYAGEQALGITEYGGLVLGGESAKFTVVYDWATNTSVHSGIRIPAGVFKQKRLPAPKLDPSKVYVTITQFDSGDAPWYWELAQQGNWQDKARGTYPMGWCVGPSTLDLLPDVMQWYYEHATPNDNFFCAISGAGYMMPPHYATKVADPEKTWREYMALTSDYMKQLDLRIVSLHMGSWGEPVTYGDSKLFKRYVDGIPGLKGILSDFGGMESLDPKRTNHYTYGGAPVFHTRNRWLFEGDPSEALAKQIKDATPDTRPAFLSIMALSWTYKPSTIKSAIDSLGPAYVFLTPEQMVDAFKACTRKP